MVAHNRKGRSKNGPSFVRLFRYVKRSQAWHDLGPYSRLALIELLDRYSGINNGMIPLSCRELARCLKCSPNTANKALQELDDAGLARPATVGVWRGKLATEWRVMFHRCDKTGDLPNTKWPAACVPPEGRQSPPRETQAHGAASCVSPEGRKGRKTQQTAPACVSRDATLIESTMGGAGEQGSPIGDTPPDDGDLLDQIERRLEGDQSIDLAGDTWEAWRQRLKDISSKGGPNGRRATRLYDKLEGWQ